MNHSQEYNYTLEGLRGLAAMWVFFAHALGWQLFDPVYRLSSQLAKSLISLTSPAHLGVLIFICLSGYVIGLTNPPKKPLSPKRYLFKRFIRIYPLYLLTVIISSLVTETTSLNQALGHLIFLNPHFVEPLSGNSVLWSISYEVIYYLLFLLIAFLLPNKKHILLQIILVITLMACFVSLYAVQGKFIASYLVGLVFWLLGMYLAWFCRQKFPLDDADTEKTVQIKKPLLSILLLIIANQSCGGGAILNGIHLGSAITSPLSLGDFFYIPIVIYVFLSFTRNTVSIFIKKACCVASFILPSTFLATAYIQGKFLKELGYFIPFILLLLSFFLMSVKSSTQILESLKWLGSISYAIYIFHIPLMLLIGKIPNVSNTLWEFLLRLCFSLTATIVIATLAEKKFQPWIRRNFQLLMP
ncbi:acyltransferase [Calothrix membranacea FACHB-236]|nr:acyltransferase [Calothrix membranacea FACHB-236]